MTDPGRELCFICTRKAGVGDMDVQSLAGVRTSTHPDCPDCRLPMIWRRTRRTFAAGGVRTMDIFECPDCDRRVERVE